MFNKATEEDLKITKKDFIKVYYEHIPGERKPFRLYEREGFLDSWRVVDEYKTLEEAQESALSRAKVVVDMGLFEKGHRKGMMSWWEQPRTARVVPEASANFDYSEQVEIERLPKSKKQNSFSKPEAEGALTLSGRHAIRFQK